MTIKKTEQARRFARKTLKHHAALLSLAKMDFHDLSDSLREIIELDAKTLSVERVSVWLYSPDHSEIYCKDLYFLSFDNHEEGLSLKASDFPRYFKALEENRILAVNDARNNPRTREFTKSYLEPNGITSMMDVPIHLHGKMIGIVCHEHIGSLREWTSEEEDFAVSVADMVSLAMSVDELQTAESKLRDERNRVRKYLNVAGVILVVLDIDGNVGLINKKGCEILGFEDQEIIGKNWFDTFIPPEIRENVKGTFDRLMRREIEPFEYFENPVVTRSGRERLIAWHNSVLTNTEGIPVGTLSSGEDITARRYAEKIKDEFLLLGEQLNSVTSPEEAAEVILGFSDSMIGWDAASLYLYMEEEDKVVPILTYDTIGGVHKRGKSKNIGKPSLMMKRILTEGPLLILQNPGNGESYSGEESLINNSEKPCSLLGVPIRRSKRTIGILSIQSYKSNVYEKSDLDLLEALADNCAGALERIWAQEERHLNALVVSNIEEAVIITTQEGIIIDANDALAKNYGLIPDSLIGLPIDRLVSPEYQRGFLKRVLRSIENKGLWSGEVPVLDKKGKVRWTKTTIKPLIDPKGKAVGLVSMSTDISSLKRAGESLRKSYQKVQRLLESTTTSLSSALEKRDPYTAGHQQRVAELSCAIAREMNLSEDRIKGIRLAAVLHDIGKISVPAEILSKPGKISETEYEICKVHAQAGYDILKSIEFPWPVAEIILQHHERMDGSGYPLGLKGDEILLEARIIAVADVVETMRTHRPYRPAFTLQEALDEIVKNRGTRYDPDVVDACIRVIKKR